MFNRTTDRSSSSFSADHAQLRFPGSSSGMDSGAGLLLLNLNTNYSQQVTRLFELGSTNVYYIGGRTKGDVKVVRAIGKRKVAEYFYKAYSDVCRARHNTLYFSVETRCEDQPSARTAYEAGFVVITKVGISVTSNGMQINDQLQMMFSSFVVK